MNKFELRSRDSYNKIADDYENSSDGRFTVKFHKTLTCLIDVVYGDVMLDVACGTGSLLNSFSKKADIKGIGVDISEKMIECAKELNPGMEFHVTGCESLPLADGCCDIITVCASYHHFPNVDAFAKEVSRVTKKGGKLYIADIYIYPILRHLCNPLIRFSKAGDFKFYSPRQIVKLFELNGFVKTDVIVEGNMQIISLQRL